MRLVTLRLISKAERNLPSSVAAFFNNVVTVYRNVHHWPEVHRSIELRSLWFIDKMKLKAMSIFAKVKKYLCSKS